MYNIPRAARTYDAAPVWAVGQRQTENNHSATTEQSIMSVIRRNVLCSFWIMASLLFIAARSTNAQNANQDFLRVRARAQSIQVPGDAQPTPRWVVIDVANAEIHVQDAD